jgi:NH3-dependent NAD+ synthetase
LIRIFFKTNLYYFASIKGYLVAGTGNKVEDFGVGFFTKYGENLFKQGNL